MCDKSMESAAYKLYMQFNYYSDILMAIPEDEAFIMIDFERIKKKFCKLFEKDAFMDYYSNYIKSQPIPPIAEDPLPAYHITHNGIDLWNLIKTYRLYEIQSEQLEQSEQVKIYSIGYMRRYRYIIENKYGINKFNEMYSVMDVDSDEMIILEDSDSESDDEYYDEDNKCYAMTIPNTIPNDITNNIPNDTTNTIPNDTINTIPNIIPNTITNNITNTITNTITNNITNNNETDIVYDNQKNVVMNINMTSEENEIDNEVALTDVVIGETVNNNRCVIVNISVGKNNMSSAVAFAMSIAKSITEEVNL